MRPSAASRPERITQLDFDSLATVADATQAENGAARNGAAQPLNTQPPGVRGHTLPDRKGVQYLQDGLFGRSAQDEAAATSQQAERQPTYEQPAVEQLQQEQASRHTFDALGELPSDAAGGIATGQHAGNGARSTGAAVERLAVRPGSSAGNGLHGGLGDRGIHLSRAGGSGRGRPVEPEPARRPARNFRITEEHEVGTGGLHEKARANIAAIRLLKTLEQEQREAADEEKSVLVRYAGWGALAQVFEPDWNFKREWKAETAAVKELLTEEEYKSARATTPNAHFTSPLVISAIWNGLQTLGVSGDIEILEPAMGIGHFFGLMPDALNGGHQTGVELDAITARIAQKLYPDAMIFAQGFEATPLPDSYFDVVVGNVPFGDYPVHDPTMKRSLTGAIHDYFFAKSLQKVRPGGVLALITSRYTMDKQDTAIRSYLSEQADLIGAIRLPNTAFKGNAGTEVTTDVLFLQKRRPGQEQQGERWLDAQPVELDGQIIPLNEYYVRRPDMMLGTLALTGTMYRGKEPTLDGVLTEECLTRAIGVLPEGVYTPRGSGRKPEPVSLYAGRELLDIIKDGGYGLVEGKIV